MIKTVFITGAVRNTGLAIARRFAAEGCNIAVSSRCEADAAETARLLGEEYSVKARGYGLSYTDVGEIRAVFSRIEEDFGALDVFVPVSANLGVAQNAMELTEADYDAVMDVNLKGTFFCMQAAAGLMRKSGGGAIVILGSVHAKAAIPGRSLYAASKGALSTLTHSLAVEWAQYGIRVNTVIAGAIRTDRWDGLTGEQMAARRKNWPVGVEPRGEDIAAGVWYLASDAARTVTGAELPIESGILSCLLNYNGGKLT